MIDLNGDHFKGITDYPELIHGDIETQDLEKLATFVEKMVGIGAITPDEPMEDYLRMTADLPERDFDTAYTGGGYPEQQQQPQEPKTEPKPAAGEADNSDPEEPPDL